jgi:uncharacterized OB-fold protein
MELPRYHRLRSTFYRMQASRCASCKTIHFPPRKYCHRCGSDEQEEAQLSDRGRILSLTRAYQPARGFRDSAGAVTALIELREGLRVIAQLTDVDPETVTPGMEVEMVVRRLRADQEQGLIVYGYKFRPPLAATAAEGEARL